MAENLGRFILAGYGSSFEWMVSSDGFHLVSDVVRATCAAEHGRGDYQFMIVASMPAEGKAGLRPVLVSPAASVLARWLTTRWRRRSPAPTSHCTG